MTTTDDKTPGPTPALLPPARLSDIRERAAAGKFEHTMSDRAALLAHLDALTPSAVPDGQGLGAEVRRIRGEFTWGEALREEEEAEDRAIGLALHAIGYAAALSTIASFTAPEALPALDPEHTPPAERTEGEVWRGRVKVDDDWAHVAVVTVNSSTSPVFFAFGKWCEPAHEFGYKVMSAWALAQRAAGRSEGEAERVRLADEVTNLRLVCSWDPTNPLDLAEARATIARLTAELAAARRDGAQEEREACALTLESLDVRPEELEAIRDGAAAIRARGEGQGS